jgi:hypothetical protein
VITPGDEYPLHQSSAPVRDPGPHRNLYDRFFFNAYDRDLETYVAVALGQYPGRDVMDAAFSVVSVDDDGVRRQRNVRASRRLGEDRLQTRVGPITVEVIEPLRRLRVVVEDPSGDVACDLAFTARSAPFEEAPYLFKAGHRTTFDYTRFTQPGTWSGWVSLPGGRTISVDDDRWWGTRDRSWGIRPVGEPDAPGAPGGERPGFFWLWAPVAFEDRCYLFDVNEQPDGSAWHAEAMAVDVGGTAKDIERGTATYRLDPQPGTRHAASFGLDLDLPSGPVHLEMAPQYPFFMHGIGYTHPEWGHGTWKGESAATSDVQVTADVDLTAFTSFHIQAPVRVERRGDGAQGVGILEQLIIGAHDPTGLTDLFAPFPG